MASSGVCSRLQAAGQCNQVKQTQKHAKSHLTKSKLHQAETMSVALKTLCSGNKGSNIMRTRPIPTKYQRAIQSLIASCMLMIVVLMAATTTSGGVQGAQSEVWSETEGLRMKYSTNHDDLLSTKGSDLSLSTNQQEEQQQAGPGQGADQASAGTSESDASTGGEEVSSSSSPSATDKSSSDESSSTTETASGSGGAGGGESESPATASDGEEEAQDAGASNSREQAADSSSRLSERVPQTNMGRVQSYSISSQHSFKQSHRTPAVIKQSNNNQPAAGHFGKAARTDVESSDEQSDDEHGPSRHASKSTKSLSAPPTKGQRDLNFDSSDAGDNDSTSGAAALSDEAAVDADADDMDGTRVSSDERNAKGKYGASKFKQPSRLFKEAVRMTGTQKSSDEDSSQASSSDDDDEQSDKSSSSSGEPSDKSSASRQQQQQQDESSRDNDDKENEYGGPQSGPRQSSSIGGNDNMIDFDQYPVAPPMKQADMSGRAYNQEGAFNMHLDGQPMPVGGPEQQMGFGGGPMSAFIADQEDESANSNQFRRPFYDNSGQSSRSTPTSAAQSERAQAGQSGAHYTRQHQHSKQQASSSPLPPGHASRASGSANPQAYKQLSYFKSVTDNQHHNHQHHQHQLASGPASANKASSVGAAPLFRPSSGPMRSPPAADTSDAADSPDNVRDNFISPGHYPGSMAHLTQAASEVKGKSAPEVAPPAASPDSSSASSNKLETKLAVAESSPKADERTPSEQQSSQQPATVAGNQQQQQQQQEPSVVAAASEPSQLLAVSRTTGEQQLAKVDELSGGGEPSAASSSSSLILVTPEPESQQEESQQIMAPILVSTTTMAPLPSTTASPVMTSSTAAPSSTTSTTTTSQAPSLKRFKFRNYR